MKTLKNTDNAQVTKKVMDFFKFHKATLNRYTTADGQLTKQLKFHLPKRFDAERCKWITVRLTEEELKEYEKLFYAAYPVNAVIDQKRTRLIITPLRTRWSKAEESEWEENGRTPDVFWEGCYESESEFWECNGI